MRPITLVARFAREASPLAPTITLSCRTSSPPMYCAIHGSRTLRLRLMEEFVTNDGAVHGCRARSIIMLDGAQQLRLRTPLARFMGPATVRNTRDILTDTVTRIINELDARKPVNFHAGVDRPIPSLVYCHLAGVPWTDASRCRNFLSEHWPTWPGPQARHPRHLRRNCSRI